MTTDCSATVFEMGREYEQLAAFLREPDPSIRLCVLTFVASCELPASGLPPLLRDLTSLCLQADCVSLAYVDRALEGVGLGIALHCDMVALGPSGSARTGDGHPGSALVLAGAIERIGEGARARLGAGESFDGAQAVQFGLASFRAASLADAQAVASLRQPVMHSIASAIRLIRPFDLEAMRALCGP